MKENYRLEFGKTILKQLKNLSKDKKIRDILSSMFDKIEE